MLVSFTARTGSRGLIVLKPISGVRSNTVTGIGTHSPSMLVIAASSASVDTLEHILEYQ